jgi:hypothetical protein
VFYRLNAFSINKLQLCSWLAAKLWRISTDQGPVARLLLLLLLWLMQAWCLAIFCQRYCLASRMSWQLVKLDTTWPPRLQC